MKLENIVKEIGHLDGVMRRHKEVVKDLSGREIYRLCRKDIIQRYDLQKGDFTKFFAHYQRRNK